MARTLIVLHVAGGTRVSMRTGSSTLNFLLGDHSLVPRDRLGSTAITTNSSGVYSSEIRYYPWGITRYTSGTTPTTFRFTGQRVEGSFGLYDYWARWSPGRAPRSRWFPVLSVSRLCGSSVRRAV